MNLDDAQRAKVAEWIEQGNKVSEIQSKLASEFGLSVTYMDVRFLIDDLKLKVKDADPKPAAPVLSGAPPAQGAPGLAPSQPQPLTPMPEDDQPGGSVTVRVDHVARPGALVSGKVTFSDGKAADWSLDQYGRLG